MIAAIVLAAGRSQRMGRPKMILPWGETTVIGRVEQVLKQSAIDEILVVTGGHHSEVELALRSTVARTIFNPHFANGEMARSLQIGIEALPENFEAALVVLGDQPQIELEVVRAVLAAYRQHSAPLVVPSFQKRRGHPWLVARDFWVEILQISPPATLRDFLNRHLSETCFVEALTPSVLLDLDTPTDYQRYRPASEGS